MLGEEQEDETDDTSKITDFKTAALYASELSKFVTAKSNANLAVMMYNVTNEIERLHVKAAVKQTCIEGFFIKNANSCYVHIYWYFKSNSVLFL